MTHRFAAGSKLARQSISRGSTPGIVDLNIRRWNLAVEIKKAMRSGTGVSLPKSRLEGLFPGDVGVAVWIADNGWKYVNHRTHIWLFPLGSGS